MSLNICFSFEDMTAALLSDLWEVFRSSTKRTWVTLSTGLDETITLCASQVPGDGARLMINSVTQNESP